MRQKGTEQPLDRACSLGGEGRPQRQRAQFFLGPGPVVVDRPYPSDPGFSSYERILRVSLKVDSSSVESSGGFLSHGLSKPALYHLQPTLNLCIPAWSLSAPSFCLLPFQPHIASQMLPTRSWLTWTIIPVPGPYPFPVHSTHTSRKPSTVLSAGHEGVNETQSRALGQLTDSRLRDLKVN